MTINMMQNKNLDVNCNSDHIAAHTPTQLNEKSNHMKTDGRCKRSPVIITKSNTFPSNSISVDIAPHKSVQLNKIMLKAVKLVGSGGQISGFQNKESTSSFVYVGGLRL
ncbi:MAG: hypothetical protein FWH37_08030 [Candidatus Bathyarchaeota archaeon]|nr:hypothetical protein [Candidatus Termiticorpusculum sp.]